MQEAYARTMASVYNRGFGFCKIQGYVLERCSSSPHSEGNSD